MTYTIRECRGLVDAEPQYELWLRATGSFPRPWRSCLKNVWHQLEQAVRFPRCRLYAERDDGTMLGYIGTHPPFEWIAEHHGPPAKSLGWAIPFGYPWTHPFDEAIATALYEEMLRVTPEIYAEFQRDIYVQRFRESWSRPIEFVERNGWRLIDRVPLIGRDIENASGVQPDLTPVGREDMELVSDLCRDDETSVDEFSASDLRDRYEGGWIVNDTFWRLGDRGVFALEVRGLWAAVTVFYARQSAWTETLRAAASQANNLGANEMYFTVESHEANRRSAIERHGFKEVDAGVYWVRDAD